MGIIFVSTHTQKLEKESFKSFKTAKYGLNTFHTTLYGTSNKKHFMKNVKECRDVIVKKYWNKVGTLVLHITHMLDL